jgi:hypothetical protein
MKKVLLGLAFVVGMGAPAAAGVWRVTSVKGSLGDTLALLGETQLTDLVVSGEADREDFFALSALENLRFLDLESLLVEGDAIPDSLFYSKKKLQKIIFPAGIRTIGESAFEKSGLEEAIRLPGRLEHIGKRAFKDCSSVASFSFSGASLRYIGIEAFHRCYSWEGTLSMPASLDSIGQGAFAFCERLGGTLTLPDSLLVVGFGEAEEGVFESCGFTRLIIGEYTERINKAAFRYCTQLSDTTRIRDHVVVEDLTVFEGVDVKNFVLDTIFSVYVTPEGNDKNSGLSWETAFRSLSRAITAVCKEGRNYHIYLGEGTYTEGALPTISRPVIYLHGGYLGNSQGVLPSVVVNHPEESGLVFKSTTGALLSLRVDHLSLMGLQVSAPLRLVGINKGYSLYNTVVHSHLALEGSHAELRDTLTITGGKVIAEEVEELVFEDLLLRRTAEATFRVRVPQILSLYYEWSSFNQDFPLLVSVEEFPLNNIQPVRPPSQENISMSPLLKWEEQEDGYLLYCTGSTSEIPEFSIIAPYALVLGDRTTYTLHAIADVSFSDEILALIEWSVGDSSLLLVKGNTVTSCGKAGETFIKARLGDNIATRDIYIGQIIIDRPDSIVIPPNQSTKFSASLLPLAITHRDIEWRVDNPLLATVDKYGMVTTGELTGVFKLTAYMVNGSDVQETRTCYVGVCIEDIVIPALPQVVVGDTLKITARITPTNAQKQEVDWSVNDLSRLDIIETDGLSCTVVAKKTGSVTLHAKAVDGGDAVYERTLTVYPASSKTAITVATPLRRSVEYNEGTLSLTRLGGFRVSLHAITGQSIATFQPAQVVENYHVPLHTGIYILSAEKGEERFITKFVVE